MIFKILIASGGSRLSFVWLDDRKVDLHPPFLYARQNYQLEWLFDYHTIKMRFVYKIWVWCRLQVAMI